MRRKIEKHGNILHCYDTYIKRYPQLPKMSEINQNNLIEYLNRKETVLDVCDHSKFKGWNDWNPTFEPELVKIGQIEQKVNMESPEKYWGDDAPIKLNEYPYWESEIHKCPKCKNIFFFYNEDGGHGRQKRYRLIQKELIDIESIVPTTNCQIISSPYKYTIYKKPDLTFELSICKPIALGVDIYHIMTNDEVKSFKKDGIIALNNRMKDMDENYSNYRVVSWR
ncbi:hypothetical protein [Aquimarina algiphila]|uniref:hypothetical protein n=1 Tax=Aquimarina algiphila TaxID=2047982 RepID=UPI00232D0E1C|nr:hypothetical protein [Aquimarina algiphila]